MLWLFQKKTDINASNRPLPHSRVTADESLYGYSESEEGTTPAGRLSLKQALQLIADHRADPKKHSNSSIAAQYKLSITLTGANLYSNLKLNIIILTN